MMKRYLASDNNEVFFQLLQALNLDSYQLGRQFLFLLRTTDDGKMRVILRLSLSIAVRSDQKHWLGVAQENHLE